MEPAGSRVTLLSSLCMAPPSLQHRCTSVGAAHPALCELERCHVLQVHNDNIYDLLAERSVGERPALQLKDNAAGHVTVSGLTKVLVCPAVMKG